MNVIVPEVWSMTSVYILRRSHDAWLPEVCGYCWIKKPDQNKAAWAHQPGSIENHFKNHRSRHCINVRNAFMLVNKFGFLHASAARASYPRSSFFFFFFFCPTCAQETSLAFTLPHKPGSFEQMLLQLLESFPLCAEIGNEPDFSILPRTIAGTHIQWP